MSSLADLKNLWKTFSPTITTVTVVVSLAVGVLGWTYNMGQDDRAEKAVNDSIKTRLTNISNTVNKIEITTNKQGKKIGGLEKEISSIHTNISWIKDTLDKNNRASKTSE